MHICFLDIDGTLVQTGGAGQAAFARTLAAEFGIVEVSRDVAFAGRSDRAIAMDLFHVHGIEPSAANWRRFSIGYLAMLEETLRAHDGCVLPGVVELLETLTARDDVALGLLTGNVREAARRKLGYYGLWDWFPFGGFGDDHLDRNDIAAAALRAAHAHLNGRSDEADTTGATRKSGASPWQVIVIGDTLIDVSCGRSIGARCVAVPTGPTSAEALRHAEPDVLVNTLEETRPILALLDGTSPAE